MHRFLETGGLSLKTVGGENEGRAASRRPRVFPLFSKKPPLNPPRVYPLCVGGCLSLSIGFITYAQNE